jgi:hypothetical protein
MWQFLNLAVYGPKEPLKKLKYVLAGLANLFKIKNASHITVSQLPFHENVILNGLLMIM